MSKGTNLGAITFIIAITIMMFVMAVGIDFSEDQGFNKFLEANKWTAWGVGVIITVGACIYGYQNIVTNKENIKSNELIAKYQQESIKNQETINANHKERMESEGKIMSKLNQNSEKDIKTKEELNNISKKLGKLTNILTEKEIRINSDIKEIKFDIREIKNDADVDRDEIAGIKQLINTHDEDIKKLMTTSKEKQKA